MRQLLETTKPVRIMTITGRMPFITLNSAIAGPSDLVAATSLSIP